MSALTKKAILQALVDGVLTELMVKTQGDNVYLDENTTVTAKIAEMVAAINLRAKSEDVTTEINNAIKNLVADAPETYDTLKEISDYISSHEDVVTTLNSAIGNKADKITVEAIQSTIDALGALSNKDKISESDLDEALAAKINAATGTDDVHANQEVLDGITADLVAEWSSKGTVVVSNTLPTNISVGDLGIQIIEETTVE